MQPEAGASPQLAPVSPSGVGPEFAAALAHELRNPLTAIVGYAGLLQLRQDEEMRRTALDEILHACGKLSSLISELESRLDGSAPGAGATAVKRSSSGPRLRVADEGGAAARRRVLIVDDDVSMRTLLRTTLRADRFQIAEAGDGDEALRAVEAHRPDLVLLDWNMPGLSGAEVLEEIARRWPDLPVLMVTAQRHARYRKRAEALGARRFLTKPFSPVELLDALDDVVGA